MLNLIKSYSFTLSLILFISSILIACTNQSTAQQQPKQHTEYYTITNISDHEYYGTNTTTNTGIYFTTDYIQSHEQLSKGDKVAATFENELDDSLINVNKVK